MTETLANKALFQGNEIRKIWHENAWWFSVVDVVGLLTKSEDPSAYWRKFKQRVLLEGNETVTFCHGLRMQSPDGKMRVTDCANVEGLLRIIQSIPSPKAEPFKLWLAKLGRERLEEMENPTLSMERARELYEQKGYPKEWIEKRLQAVSVRKNLTDEWKGRGAQEGLDFAILSNEIMQHAFGMKVDEYKEHKGLTRQELRDHMTELELIITMLGEATTTKLTKERDSHGVPKLKRDAKDGGTVAGNARKDIETRSSVRVISKSNFLQNNKNKRHNISEQ